MSLFQQTIKKPVSVEGIGLHTGKKVKVTFKPAPTDHGYVFKRLDVPGEALIRADVDNVVDTSRGTTIGEKGVKVSTIEHTLAACIAMEVDNVLIELDSQELPIMDGSAKMFVEALTQAGVQEQDAEKESFKITENIYHVDPENNVELIAVPSDEEQITVMIDYKSPILGFQHAICNVATEFKDQFSDARTFCFLHELDYLFEQNLIKGGDTDNAIVVVDKVVDDAELSRLAKKFNKPKIAVLKEGILNNVELRYSNEPARHKLLDIVGDLALIGTPIKAKIIASRPGHTNNVQFAKKIKNHIREQKGKNKNIPFYDVNKKPVYDINQIAKNLPHKYPFLLVDKIIDLTENRVVGVKNVTFNEPFFQGHFPGNPVMPGVLQIEAMAQTGGILVLQTVTDPENWDTYFLKIDNAKFKNKVVPGDTLILKLELLSPIRRGICEMRGTAYVGDKVACEADLVAKIIRKTDA
jgi:UDP-3-O-[3-hydroxymyristoyl] N-acetylglucosamine deacetylase / 3-hydroxyacyl-[acyl-carrier-protein] dehydratase